MGKGMEVLQAGLLTTVQDAGRFGYQKMGIPVSGAMDLSAYHTANLLAGNPGNEAVLEMTLQGGRFLFLENAVPVGFFFHLPGRKFGGEPEGSSRIAFDNCFLRG